MNVQQKRGNIIFNNLLGLIIAAAGILILISLFFQLINPTYEVKTETLKGYNSILREGLREADDSGMSEISFFVNPHLRNTYFLAYFGEKRVYSDVHYGSNVEDDGSLLFRTSFTKKDYFADFFVYETTDSNVCLCYVDTEPVKTSEASFEINHSQVPSYDSRYRSIAGAVIADVNTPLTSQENTYYAERNVNSLQKIYYSAHVTCNQCYNVGDDFSIVHTSENTKTGGEANIIDLDSVSSIIITREGSSYVFEVFES